jgi:hypothetical protein
MITGSKFPAVHKNWQNVILFHETFKIGTC